MPVRWVEENHRLLAISGEAAIGAVFPGGARRIRWRAWVTMCMNPVEGTAKNIEAAKAEVETRFQNFCKFAQLKEG